MRKRKRICNQKLIKIFNLEKNMQSKIKKNILFSLKKECFDCHLL